MDALMPVPADARSAAEAAFPALRIATRRAAWGFGRVVAGLLGPALDVRLKPSERRPLPWVVP